MALQELSTNVINTMVKQSTKRKAWLRISLLVCVAMLGVQTIRGQHAFEYAARVGANVFHYETNYGKPMPNYNVGMDFMYKYRFPRTFCLRGGLGIDVAAGTFVAQGQNNPELVYDAPYSPVGYRDNYVVPRSYEPNNMLVNMSYEMERFTETQQMIIASGILQGGFYIGSFSIFAGVRPGVYVHGCYWQRIKNANMKLYFPDTDVTIPNAGQINNLDDMIPETYDEKTTAGNVLRTVNGINPLPKGAYPQYELHLTVMADLNYSFQIGEKTDIGIGAYIEYEPIKHEVTATDNTSLMEWRYAVDEHTNDPVFRREYTSVLQASRADGVTMRNAGEIAESQVVKRFNRASVGIRISVSLWSVPLDFGTNYRKQQKYRACKCDFDN